MNWLSAAAGIYQPRNVGWSIGPISGGPNSLRWVNLSLLFAWGLAAAGFQASLRRKRRVGPVVRAWMSTDVLLATILLIIDGQPMTPLTLVYAVLIAASGLWSRTRVVAFTTALAMIGYVVLIAEGWAYGKPIGFRYGHLDFLVGLALMGFLTAYQARRVRALGTLHLGRAPGLTRTGLRNNHSWRSHKSPERTAAPIGIAFKANLPAISPSVAGTAAAPIIAAPTWNPTAWAERAGPSRCGVRVIKHGNTGASPNPARARPANAAPVVRGMANSTAPTLATSRQYRSRRSIPTRSATSPKATRPSTNASPIQPNCTPGQSRAYPTILGEHGEGPLAERHFQSRIEKKHRHLEQHRGVPDRLHRACLRATIHGAGRCLPPTWAGRQE